MKKYVTNILSMSTRLLNALLGGDVKGESTSSAVARKAAEGRAFFIIVEAMIDLLFAAIRRERHHCERNRENR